MKLNLLFEFDSSLIAQHLRTWIAKAKGGVNRERANLTNNSPSVSQPQRSGNLSTPPANPKHRSLMGIQDLPNAPHGSPQDKPGTPPQQNRATPTSMGQPFDRAKTLNKNNGMSSTIGNDASLFPVDTNEKPGKTRQDAPSEKPGRQKWSTRPQWHNFGKHY